MSLMDRIWKYQHRIDSWRSSLPVLSQRGYFQFLSIIFFIMGVLLFLYCFVKGINPLLQQDLSSPLLYLGLGLLCSLCFLLSHQN